MDRVNKLFLKLRLPQVNQVVLIIIFGEFILTVAGALTAPLFALFVVKDVGAPVTVIGFAIAIYWITKSLLQIPIARYLDKNHGEVDDYYSILGGLLLTIICIYAYYFVRASWHIFVLQFFIGIGDAFIVPPFFATFTRHIDRNQEAFEWSLRSSFAAGVGTALGGAFSGILAATIGIRPLYLINGTLMLIGFIILLFLKSYIRPKVPHGSVYPLVERGKI